MLLAAVPRLLVNRGTRIPSILTFSIARRQAMSSTNETSAAPEPAIGDITSPPAAGKIIRHEGVEYQTVQEGRAFILISRSSAPKEQASNADQQQQEKQPQAVFYNPIQQFNRDLTTLAIRAFGEHSIGEKKAKHERSLVHQQRQKGTKRKREADVSPEDKASGVADDANAKSGAGMEIDDGAGAQAHSAEVGSGTPKPHIPKFTILDALSATGLRALRFAKEIPFATSIVGNDLSSSAIAAMQLNIQYNGVGKLVQPHKGDARTYLHTVAGGVDKTVMGVAPHGKFDVVDLDPYGTAAPFLDAAVQAVRHGGLVCVTCTDAGIFASNGYPEKAFALYGGTTLKGLHSHEGGLRLILYALATSAAKYGLAIEPMLSLSIDYYVRIFVRVHESPLDVKYLASKSMIVYNCDSGCGAWKTQPLAALKEKKNKAGEPFYNHTYALGSNAMPVCDHCGFKTHVGGPMWGGPLHNPIFIQRILDLLPGADPDVYPTAPRMEGMLVTALEEDLSIDQPDVSATEKPGASPLSIPRVDPRKVEPHPFFFIPSILSKVLHARTVPENALRGALKHLGYRSSRSHARPGSIRTDAPWEVIWEIIREWVRQKAPVKATAIKAGTAGEGIMKKSRERINAGTEGSTVNNDEGDDIDEQEIGDLRKEIAAIRAGKSIADLVSKVENMRSRQPDQNQQQQQQQQQQQKQEQEQVLNQQQEPRQSRPSSPKKPSQPRPRHPSTLDIVFDEDSGKNALAHHRNKRLRRYQVNPRPNWGPISRADAN